jgi:class 3 adenylate cyclase
MQRGLLNGKSFAVMGGRRCGKTSFLMQLQLDLRKASEHGLVPSLLDIQGVVPRSAGEFFGAIYGLTVQDTDAKPWSGHNYQDFLASLDRGRGLIERRYGPNWVRVLLVDELDSASANLPDSECFQNLRNLLMSSRYSRHFRVVATGVSFLCDLISDRTSPLNNLDPEYLSILPIDASRELTSVGFPNGFPDQAEMALFARSGRHPYILQGLLEYLWEGGGGVDESTIKSTVRRFVRDRSATFRRWIRDFRQEGCAVYEVLSQESLSSRELRARLPKTIPVDEGLTKLSYHGVIDECDPDAPRVSSSLFRDWFRENYYPEHAKTGSLGGTTTNEARSEARQRLEIAHVLFMDIVSYSTMPLDLQRRIVTELQDLVRSTEEFDNAQGEDRLIRLPTGDGMALVFFGDPEAPVRCALELSKLLRVHPEIKLRMGIHSGPVYRLADINANRNVSGGGINIAQRVMDCGDAGHILVSSTVADVLVQLTAWKESLLDLGETRVKHDVQVHLFNVCTDNVGNKTVPKKLRGTSDPITT